MSTELRPLGVKCNIQCQYCYQDPQRDAGNVIHRYDMDLMKDTLARQGEAFTLFGGEPLLIPRQDLEELWRFGLEKFGYNNIQTNGSLITEEHIELFKTYKVSVGLSIDGPGSLNDVRWAGSLEKTRRATERSERAIELLCDAGHPPSLIVTLHRNNATEDKLPRMREWFRYLEARGVTAARLHILEVDNAAVGRKYALSTRENLEAFLSFAEFEKSELSRLRLDVFNDMRNMLAGRDNNVTCVWTACDPYTTRAVQGVEGNGQRSNCGRTNKDGIDFVKADTEGFERYMALYQTPVEHGGCRGCRFFLMCKGQCPGTAMDGDWRNRTEHCELWYRVYEHIEADLIDSGAQPLSQSPRRGDIEAEVLADWSQGRNGYIGQALERLGISPAGLEASDAPAGDS